MINNNKTWFVTGASKGLGLILTQQLLSRGFRVAATSRNVNELIQAVGHESTAAFLPLAVNLQSEDSVKTAVDNIINHFGKIDVVVNNAGYGLSGALEELTDQEARDNFDINVFGTLNIIRQVMPHLRQQQLGHIINISSIGGFTGNFPGFGIYCATKFAVQGLTESLAAEIKPFGIHATVVSPGYFRTSFLTSGSLNVPQYPINDYEAVRNSQSAHQNSINGNQPGDPEKAVNAIIQIADTPQPPLHLFLGTDAYQMAYAKVEAIQQELETWKELGTSTDFNTGQ